MIKPNKLPKEVVSLLEERLKDEFTAYYNYRHISNWCQNEGFFKAAEFYANESNDELSHAKKIEDFLTLWNVLPELPVIKTTVSEISGLAETIEASYKMEYALYEEYEDTSAKIFKIGDICAFDFLQQFRSIQTKSVGELSDKINILTGINTGDKFQMLLLEKKLF